MRAKQRRVAVAAGAFGNGPRGRGQPIPNPLLATGHGELGKRRGLLRARTNEPVRPRLSGAMKDTKTLARLLGTAAPPVAGGSAGGRRLVRSPRVAARSTPGRPAPALLGATTGVGAHLSSGRHGRKATRRKGKAPLGFAVAEHHQRCRCRARGQRSLFRLRVRRRAGVVAPGGAGTDRTTCAPGTASLSHPGTDSRQAVTGLTPSSSQAVAVTTGREPQGSGRGV